MSRGELQGDLVQACHEFMPRNNNNHNRLMNYLQRGYSKFTKLKWDICSLFNRPRCDDDGAQYLLLT